MLRNWFLRMRIILNKISLLRGGIQQQHQPQRNELQLYIKKCEMPTNWKRHYIGSYPAIIHPLRTIRPPGTNTSFPSPDVCDAQRTSWVNGERKRGSKVSPRKVATGTNDDTLLAQRCDIEALDKVPLRNRGSSIIQNEGLSGVLPENGEPTYYIGNIQGGTSSEHSGATQDGTIDYRHWNRKLLDVTYTSDDNNNNTNWSSTSQLTTIINKLWESNQFHFPFPLPESYLAFSFS